MLTRIVCSGVFDKKAGDIKDGRRNFYDSGAGIWHDFGRPKRRLFTAKGARRRRIGLGAIVRGLALVCNDFC